MHCYGVLLSFYSVFYLNVKGLSTLTGADLDRAGGR